MSRVLQFYIEETGVVKDFAGTTAPSGYLMCFGQAVSRTQYSALFAVIGTTYGAGDGTTTFNLPDARGRVAAGVDNMGGTAANRLTSTGGVAATAPGAVGGAQTHTLTQAQLPAVAPTFTGTPMPAHGHPFRASYSQQTSATSNTTGGIVTRTEGASDQDAHDGTATDAQGEQVGGESAGTPAGTISNLGSGAAHPNVQPTIVFNKIIKT